VSKATARELLDTIKKHEEFLNDLEWSRDDDCLVFLLASRVELVLAKAQDNKQAVSTRGQRYWAGWQDAMGLVVRLLNGEEE
jgi:hypothetical protein